MLPSPSLTVVAPCISYCYKLYCTICRRSTAALFLCGTLHLIVLLLVFVQFAMFALYELASLNNDCAYCVVSSDYDEQILPISMQR
jgi:hypothetical protein